MDGYHSPLDIIVEHPVLVLITLEEIECCLRVKILVLNDSRWKDGRRGIHKLVHELGCL